MAQAVYATYTPSNCTAFTYQGSMTPRAISNTRSVDIPSLH
jgi:hypothetical protein